MLQSLASSLGPWSWWIFGLLLLAAELLVPGVFLIWIGASAIIVGALIASAAAGSPTAKWLGLVAVALASVNIFGGFAVTERMLAMYKKKG